MRFKISEAKITFTVERLNDDGQVEQVADVPARLFESQFGTLSVATLAEQVLAAVAEQASEPDEAEKE
jgi:hypothetical protein